MTKTVIISLIIVLSAINIQAQTIDNVIVDKKEFKIEEKKDSFKDAYKNIKEGDALFEMWTAGKFMQALDFYLKAYEYNSQNAELNYKIGYCYLRTTYKRKALKYLQAAYKLKPDVALDINLFLGEACQYNYMFDDAIKEYQKFNAKANSDLRMIYSGVTTKKINECKNGKKFFENVNNVMIQNISSINSSYPDYSPLITADESLLIFTSRREGSSEGKISENDGLYFEDIYSSENINGQWTKPKNVGAPLNTKGHDATVGLSADGQKLFIYRDFDIYVSEKEGDLWTKPKKMPKTINTKDQAENSACFSPDEKTIYFIRGKSINPKTSNGDIYYSKLINGEWTEARKLPANINSKYDEDGVFMHPDGKTMYFSSKGHNTMGGYDIFKTERQDDGSWKDPENMGIPVNSPDDDIYFVMAADGRTAYYSSVQPGGKGATDIYKLTFVKLDKPLTISTEDNLIACLSKPVSEANIQESIEIKKIYLTIVKGVITDGYSHAPINAKIEITDNSTGHIIMEFYSNSKSGRYLISLPSGKNYGMNVSAPDYSFHSENFNIPKAEKYQEVIKDVELYKFKKGTKIILRNVFFDTDKYVLRPESNAELDRLVKILNENPSIRIEISGHTDSQGSYQHNVTLSKNRANAVLEYLVKHGISQSRLESRGASWDEPVDTNKTPEGRQNNRRVQFEIL